MQLLLQGSVGLLSAGKVAGGEALADLVEILEQGILAARVSASASAAEMVVLVEVVAGEIVLEILLGGREILLRGGNIVGLEVGAELVEGLRNGVGRGASRSGASSGGGLRKGCLQSGEIGLRGRQVAGLKSLAELLHLPLVRIVGGADLVLIGAAVQNRGDGH